MTHVWHDAWQRECCGDPITVRDEVALSLPQKTELAWLEVTPGPDRASAVTHVEEHHEVEAEAVGRTGNGAEHPGASCRFAPKSRDNQRLVHPAQRTSEITPTPRAHGSEGSAGELSFIGYLVELDVQNP